MHILWSGDHERIYRLKLLKIDVIMPMTISEAYRIYSIRRRGAYLIFRATSAALIRGRRLFE